MTRPAPSGKRRMDEVAFRESLARSRRRASQAAVLLFCVEGEQVTLADIAARLGCSKDAARGRLRREQAKPGPVTWAGLS